MAKSVFYSFHYDRDAWRVQQIIQMGALHDASTDGEDSGLSRCLDGPLSAGLPE